MLKLMEHLQCHHLSPVPAKKLPKWKIPCLPLVFNPVCFFVPVLKLVHFACNAEGLCVLMTLQVGNFFR